MKIKNILSNSIRHAELVSASPYLNRLRIKSAMTKSVLLILCLQCVFTAGSCQKHIPPEPKPPKPKPEIPTNPFPTKLEILWNAPFYSDTAYDYFWDYKIANNQYIVLANLYDRTYNRPRGIGVYNMQTGERHPAWTNDPGGIFALTERECKLLPIVRRYKHGKRVVAGLGTAG